MTMQWFRRIGWLPLIGLSCLAPARADDGAIKMGIDYYSGVSDLEGERRFSDGMWAGSSAAYPSVGYLRWEDGKGSAAKLSVGLGSMYTDPGSTLDQPVEAWWQAPAGKASVTVGKFWVPFALQEWQYETKPGVMLQCPGSVPGGRLRQLQRGHPQRERVPAPRPQLRAGPRTRGFPGGGKGLSYTQRARPRLGAGRLLRLAGLARERRIRGNLRDSSSRRFYFGYGKLSYENLGAWKPFVARYLWTDDGEAFGRFRSTTYGVGHQVAPGLALEGLLPPPQTGTCRGSGACTGPGSIKVLLRARQKNRGTRRAGFFCRQQGCGGWPRDECKSGPGGHTQLGTGEGVLTVGRQGITCGSSQSESS